MEDFKKHLSDFCDNTDDYFNFVNDLDDVLNAFEKLGIIKESSYKNEHIFDSPSLEIYAISVAIVFNDGSLFHFFKSFLFE